MANLDSGIPSLLSEVMTKMSMYLSDPVWVEINRRDVDGVVTHKADVPIRMVKPNFDGKGIALRIEESEIVFYEAH